jgi:hypothetical protein
MRPVIVAGCSACLSVCIVTKLLEAKEKERKKAKEDTRAPSSPKLIPTSHSPCSFPPCNLFNITKGSHEA